MLRIPVLVRSCLVALTIAVTACAGEAPAPGPAQVVDLLSDVQPQDQPEERDGEEGGTGSQPWVPCEDREGATNECDRPCEDRDGDNYCDDGSTCEDGTEGNAENRCDANQPCEDSNGDNYCDYEDQPPATNCENREDGTERCEEGGQPGTPYCGCELILEMCPGFGERCEGGECVRVCDTANEICVECNAGGECRACQGAECAEFSCNQWYETCQERCIAVYGGGGTGGSPEGGEEGGGEAPQAPCENAEGGECREDGSAP